VLVASSIPAISPLIWRAVPPLTIMRSTAGLLSRAMCATELSFCSVNEDSSCGAT
jgi:hypothetical protein